MRKLIGGKNLSLVVGCLLFVAGCQVGQEMATDQTATAQTDAIQPGTTQKTLMHAFAYTAIEEATEEDFEAFKNATADMVGKIPGLRKVWVGKLRLPATQVTRERTHGVAMEFDDEEALAVYADHPVHTEWVSVYERVRVPGTTTFDILGE